MLNGQKIRRTNGGGGDGFLRPSDAAAVKITKKFVPPSSHNNLPFDQQWPYSIDPLRAYLCGVITVWVVVIIYHFVMSTIHAVRKRKRTNRRRHRQSRRKDRPAPKNENQPQSLHTVHSLRPTARMAEIPPKSPVYQPCKKSVVKVRRKLANKIARSRAAFRKRRQSRREFVRSVKKKEQKQKAALLPTSPSYELFRHMNTQPLCNVDGGRVTESRLSFVSSASEKKIAEQHRINDIPPEEINETANNAHEETVDQEATNVIEDTASSGEKTFVILISSGSYEYTQKAQQKEALDLFNDLQIAHKTVDGMDSLQREKRDHLFQVSGRRGNYPQIFKADDNGHTYLGGYDWLQSMDFADLRKIVE